jgi:hypothetical protein
MVWTDSWPSIAGEGCSLICVVQMKNKCERSMPLWPPRSGETSRILFEGPGGRRDQVRAAWWQEKQDEVIKTKPVQDSSQAIERGKTE